MVTLVKEENFAAEVLEAAGGVVVDLYADWCNPCKAMAPVIEALSQTMPEVKFCKCNIDQAPSLPRQYRVFSIPAFLVFRDGERKATIVGEMEEGELEEEIRKALEQ
jgi:thioredoxin 1